MHRVSERVETRKPLQWNVRIRRPDLRLWNYYQLGKRSRAVNPNAASVVAEVAAASQTISAASANYVPLPGDNHPGVTIMDVAAHDLNYPHKLMPNHHRSRDRSLCPIIPLENMNIGATDGRAKNSDENLKFANLWNRNLVEPKTGCALFLHERFHGWHSG